MLGVALHAEALQDVVVARGDGGDGSSENDQIKCFSFCFRLKADESRKSWQRPHQGLPAGSILQLAAPPASPPGGDVAGIFLSLQPT